MEFKVLGPLVVLDDHGAAVPLASVAQRRLASLLAMRAGTIVSADFLADHLELSSGALRTSITRLRRLVGNDLLLTVAPGYELRTCNLDAQRFEQLLVEARSAEPTVTRAALEQAVALWHGGAYHEFAHEPWAIGEVTRLDELRSGAIEDLAELLLASSEWSSCIAKLEPLIDAQPFRDRPRRLLMEALARSGRRTDALRAYQAYRRFLLDEVGIEPSATVVALDRAISQEDYDVATTPEVVRAARLPTLSVSDDHARRTPFPLPRRLSQMSRTGFAGRVNERMQLRRDFQEALNGERRVALIGGEPGIGKTRLASSAALAAYDEGATVLLGRCDEDVSVPYQAWVEALDHLVRHAPDETLGRVAPRHLTELSGLIPNLGDRYPEVERRTLSTTDTDQYFLFESVAALLEAASSDDPIVLVFDDVHWADKPTLLMLRHVVQSSASLRVQIMVTFRDGRIDASSSLAELLGALAREDVAHRMSLAGLLDAEIVEMIEGRGGHALDQDGIGLARELRRETDGNPFFLGELLRYLAESGSLLRDENNRWMIPGGLHGVQLPETVKDVIRQRVARLGLSAQHILRLAAVVGRDFDIDVVSVISAAAPTDVLDVLERAEAASLVNEVPGDSSRYTFAHALVQQSLYEDLGLARCRLAHRQIGEALEQLRADGASVRISELAQHWMDGGRPTDWAKMVLYAREVGDAAALALAPDEAARWYGDALAVLDRQPQPDQRLRAELLIALGTTVLKGGETFLLEAAQTAQREQDDELLIKAVLADRRGWQSTVGRVAADRIAVAEAALEAVGTHDSDDRARLLKAYATDLAYSGDPGKCWRLDQEAVNVARRLGNRKTLLHVLLRRPVGFWAPDSLEYRLAASREAVILAEEINDQSSMFWAYNDLAFVAVSVGSRAEFDRAVERHQQIEVNLGQQPGFDWLITAFFCVNALLKSDLDDAQRLAYVVSSQAIEAGNRDVDALLTLFLSNIAWQRGESQHVIAPLQEVVARSARLNSNRALLARAFVISGEDERALELMQAEFLTGIDIPWDRYWMVATSYWAEVAALTHHHGAAELLYRRLLPWSNQIVAVSAMIENAVSFYLGLLASELGEHEAADVHFSAALSLVESLGATFQIARTKLEWGRLLVTAPNGDYRWADQLLQESRKAARQFGFERVGRDAERLLKELARVEIAT
jgi:DNA-binding SARP family transcriptional activator